MKYLHILFIVMAVSTVSRSCEKCAWTKSGAYNIRDGKGVGPGTSLSGGRSYRGTRW